MIKVYYFDGSTGCEKCRDATAYSFEPPERPHDGCDCQIIEEDVVLDDFEIQYRNLLPLEDYVVWMYDFSIPDCVSYDRIFTIEFDDDEINTLPSYLEELARDDGWSPPEIDGEDQGIDVPADMTTSGYFGYLRYTAEILVDVYAVGRIGDEVFEEELESQSGHYEVNVRFVDMNFGPTPC